MDLTELARLLNRAKINAAPCPWLGALSIFDDEHYENFDVDMIGPRDRRRIAAALTEEGWRQRGGRRIESRRGAIELPRPTRSLSADPALEFEALLDRGDAVPLATPTQIVLATWRRLGPDPDRALVDALTELLHEQPANLDKVTQWLRRTPGAPSFRNHEARFVRAQRDGFELRRQGRFRSQLPR